MNQDLTLRAAEPRDYDRIIAVADAWWGRPIAGALPRLFLDHFHPTSTVAEAADGEMAGFLVGFFSPGDARTAYIQFVGVHPGRRKDGLGRALYEHFFARAAAAGRSRVKAITGPVNATSIAFHRAMGFTASDPVADYDGPGNDRVVFERALP